ncbi:actin-3-like [Huso huso]|uniref:Actin-3-like n=1 Tax=Huso huso TaxID=61971 RepID=A0ABR0Z863_HUSHU
MDRQHLPKSRNPAGRSSTPVPPRTVSSGPAIYPQNAPKETFKETVAIIVDSGSGYTKAGFSGDEQPRTVLKSSVGIIPQKSRSTKEGPEYFIGYNIPKERVDVVKKKPITHGIVTDWDALEKLWHHTFYWELRICPEEHGILVTDAPLSPTTNREKMAELLFEEFRVPAMYVAHQSLLSVYSYGRTTGLVVESGSGATYVSPIHNGYSMPHATFRLDLAGRALTEYLGKLMADAGNRFSSQEKPVVREIKKQCCYISQDYEAELRSEERGYLMDYVLPDGHAITLGSERFRCPEILFCPSTLGVSEAGIHVMTMNSLQKCPTEQHEQMMDSIMVCGGSSLLRGFPERLKKEMIKLAPRGAKINVIAGPHREFSAWVGGSIMACLNSFQPMWVSSQDYNERGPFMVHHKCY